MSRPHRYVLLMLLGILAVAGLGWLLKDRLTEAFSHNPALNSGIFGVLAIGIIFIFFQVFRLYPAIAWIDQFRRVGQDLSTTRPPRLLAPLAAMLRARLSRASLSAVSLRAPLDATTEPMYEA